MSPFWLTALIWTAVFIVADILRPKPKFEDARPAAAGDFSFPTATEGRVVPIIWGRVRLAGPNVVWYGNIRSTPITEEVQTGIFSDDEVTVGYRYFVAIQLALCLGPVDKIEHVWIDDIIAASGVSDGDVSLIPWYHELGGDDVGGNGRVNAFYAKFYSGSLTQAKDTFLDTYQTPCPAYRGTAYVVFDGTIGNSPSLGNWQFELSRRPDGLNMASADPGAEAVNTNDANPMNVIYEILTNTEWGLKIDTADIDVSNFQTAASTLATEGNGWSFTLDNQIEATDLLNEVQRQIDGELYYDRTAKNWKLTLIRADYTPANLPVFDVDNIQSIKQFSRTTWEETTNEVRLQFVDTNDSFKTTYATAQDIANIEIQGGVVSVDVKYPGCKNANLANRLAWRELSTLSYPLSKITFTVNREAWDLAPGAAFKVTAPKLLLDEAIFRVNRVNYGEHTDRTIEIVATEDIFAVGVGLFDAPQGTVWDDPISDPTEVVEADTLTFEAPRQMVARAPVAPDNMVRVFGGARSPGAGTTGFRMYVRFDTSRPLSGLYTSDSAINKFLYRSELDSNLTDYGSNDNRPATDYSIELTDASPDDLAELVTTGSPSKVEQLINIVYIDGEFIGYENVVDQGGGVYTLERVYRGLFNTAPKSHSSGTDVWFIGQTPTGGNITMASLADADDEIDLQLRSFNSLGTEVDGVSTPVAEFTLTRLWRDPLPPRDPELNGVYAPSSEDVDTDYTTETGFFGDNGLGIMIEFTARAWRVDSVIKDNILSLSGVPWSSDSPNYDVLLRLDPDGSPIDVAVVNISGDDTPDAVVTRNSIIEACGSNTQIPGTGRFIVTSKHTPVEGSTEYTAQNTMDFDFTVTSALQGSDLIFGALIVNTASDSVTFGETGTYSFDIHSSLPSSGILEGRINGGSWTTIVSAGMSSGTLAGVTASDTVELRFDQTPNEDQFFDITGPSSEVGYGVLLS